MRGPVTVHVPASSANLGPAFDCAGLALDIWDTFTAELTEERGVRVSSSGEGAADLPTDCSHLVAESMRRGFDEIGVRPAGWTLQCTNRIPHARGLGSSAAAIIGGLVLARALAEAQEEFTDVRVLQTALALEPHPDNLSAALVGGLTIAWNDTTPGLVTLALHPEVSVTVLIPKTPLATQHARAVLPNMVSFDAAVQNVSRAALLAHALTSDPSLIMVATEDRLHQQQRADIYPAALALVNELRARDIPAVVSGAGPSVLAFADVDSLLPHVDTEIWQPRMVTVPTHGAWVEGAP
jgi:homoserine kinase